MGVNVAVTLTPPNKKVTCLFQLTNLKVMMHSVHKLKNPNFS